MDQHLTIIFASLLNVDNKDLLEPERQLRQTVPFEDTGDISGGPIGPYLAEIIPVLRIVPKELKK